MNKHIELVQNLFYLNKNKIMKSIIRLFIPPIILKIIKKILSIKEFDRRDFSSWKEALKKTTSYDTEDVFDKTLQSARKVRDGKAVYERDSVIFDNIQYDWQLLSSILFISNVQKRLNIVDFGGALGTSYRQNSKYLDAISVSKKWAIIEQRKYVQIGKNEFENNEISFHESLSEITFDVDMFLMAGSICYIENPYKVLEEIIALKPKFILIVRTPFSSLMEDKISIQYVPKSIYDASFPIWILSEKKFKSYLSDFYEVLEEWKDDLQADTDHVAKGMLFKRNEN